MSTRIAIVDDSLTVRMDLGEAFAEAGFETVLCASAEEARRVLVEQAPGLLVLDVVLDDADGVALLAELRGKPETKDLPVILLSAESQVRDRVRGLTQGANEYIGKPYDAPYVVARAADLLRQARDLTAPPAVLVVDDSLTYREALSEMLQQAGYRVVLAASGEEGLKKAAELRPDALIVDGVMPEMDGNTVVRRLRLDPALYGTPCLLLTASEGAEAEVSALDAGADAYARKAEGADVVLARLGALLRASGELRERHAHATSLMGPRRILAVDDSPTYLAEVAGQLAGDGFEVVKARSGEDALALLAVEQVDCILLDLMMPGLSGTETCRRVKSSFARHVPLIMLTAVEEPEAVVEGMNAGADDYVAKSASFDVIKARVRAQLRRKEIEDERRRGREEILKKDAETRAARERAETHAHLLNELRVKHRELELLNGELQMFAYSVSHDLRQPLRSLDGFSQVLLERYGQQLDDTGRHYLERIRAGAQRMGQLIDGLLLLSRVTGKELQLAPVRLDAIARRVLEHLREAEPGREVEWSVVEPMEALGDAQLLESLLENLLGNAWKFSIERRPARIHVGETVCGDTRTFLVRDNGAGFRMDYASKLFVPFQRLHSEREFPGTGIGLATVQRIVHRHGGKIWAESEPGYGAAFYFTLVAR